MRNQPSTNHSIALERGRASRLALLALVALVGFGAVAACSDGKKASGTSSASGGNATVNQILDDGVKAQNSGNLDVARQKYLEVIEKDPTNKIAFYDLGVVYQTLKDVNNARDAYQKALLIDAKYVQALYNLAILETPGNAPRAEDLYRQILAIDSNDANVHLKLGLLLKAAGRDAEGDAEIATAIQIDPSYSTGASSASESSSPASASS